MKLESDDEIKCVNPNGKRVSRLPFCDGRIDKITEEKITDGMCAMNHCYDRKTLIDFITKSQRKKVRDPFTNQELEKEEIDAIMGKDTTTRFLRSHIHSDAYYYNHILKTRTTSLIDVILFTLVVISEHDLAPIGDTFSVSVIVLQHFYGKIKNNIKNDRFPWLTNNLRRIKDIIE